MSLEDDLVILGLRAELDKLRAFATAIMMYWPDGDVDGGGLQEMAIKYGLLSLADPAPTAPCAVDCMCAEYYGPDDWHDGVECYRRTALIDPDTNTTGAPR